MQAGAETLIVLIVISVIIKVIEALFGKGSNKTQKQPNARPRQNTIPRTSRPSPPPLPRSNEQALRELLEGLNVNVKGDWSQVSASPVKNNIEPPKQADALPSFMEQESDEKAKPKQREAPELLKVQVGQRDVMRQAIILNEALGRPRAYDV